MYSNSNLKGKRHALIAANRYFGDRGISEEMRELNNVRVLEPSEAKKVTNWQHSAILFPYEDGYWRARFLPDSQGQLPQHQNRTTGKITVQKAAAPKGEPPRLYFPILPGCDRDWIERAKQRVDIPIVLVEGDADALKVAQDLAAIGLERLVIGICGCWGWRSDGKPIPNLDEVVWSGREVRINLDGDWATNPKVRAALRSLGYELGDRDAQVFAVGMPIYGAKVGGGDYCHHHGARRYQQQLDKAIPFEKWVETWTEHKCSAPNIPQLLDFFKYQYGDRLHWNELTQTVELDDKPLAETSDLAHVWLAEKHRLAVRKDRAEDALKHFALKHSYHPVRNELICIETDATILPLSGEEWSRLSEWYFGTSQQLFNIYLCKFLLAAIARILKPGCKVDTTLVLQGAQGIGKSTFLKLLAGGEKFFNDSIRGNTSEKDALMALVSAWIVEWGEIENVFSSRSVSHVKAFLSCQTDKFRAPYDRRIRSHPRSCVICGSTNKDEFLADPTGSRRFWVIPVASQIDLDRFGRERDRVLKAAILRYRAGEHWWLSEAEQALSEKLNCDYERRDPWHEAIESYLKPREVVTVSEILRDCIQQDLEKQDRRSQMRAADVLRSLGWTKQRRRIDGERSHYWARPKIFPVPSAPTLNEGGKDGQDAYPEQLTVTLSRPSPQKTRSNFAIPDRRIRDRPFNVGDIVRKLCSEGDTVFRVVETFPSNTLAIQQTGEDTAQVVGTDEVILAGGAT